VRQVSNPLLNELRSLLREQRALMDELMTSRRSRLERAEREGKMEKDFVRMLQQMAKRSANVLVSEESDAPALPPANLGNHSEEGGSS
jgi:phosphoribosylaminoimidazole-succinocarboxamide synthase